MLKQIALALASLACLTACASHQPHTTTPIAADSFAQIDALRIAGDWTGAAALVEAQLAAFNASTDDDDRYFELSRRASEIYHGLEDFEAAQNLEEKALSRALNLGRHKEELEFTSALAETLYWRSEEDAALALVQAGLANANDTHEDLEATISLHILKIRLAGDRGDQASAITHLENVFARLDADKISFPDELMSSFHLQASRTYRNYAWTVEDDPDQTKHVAARDASLMHGRKAVELSRKVDPNRTETAINLETLSRSEWMYGDKDNAIAHLEDATSILDRAGLNRGRDYILMAGYLAFYLSSQGRSDEALVVAERNVDRAQTYIADKMLDPAGVDVNAQIALTFAVTSYLSAQSDRLTDGYQPSSEELDHIFQSAQMAHLSPIASTMAMSAASASRRDETLYQSVRQLQQLQSQWRSLDQQLALASQVSTQSKDFHTLVDTRAALETDIVQAQAALEQVDGKYNALWGFEPVALTDLQAVLKDDEAYILMTKLYSDIYIFAATREAATFHVRPSGSGEICLQIRNVRNSLTTSSQLRCELAGTRLISDASDEQAFDPLAAHTLYNSLFGGLSAETLSRPRWTITWSGDMSALPPGVLLTEPAQATDSFADMHWLGREKALMITPSAEALVALRSQDTTGPVPATDQLIAAGSPCIGRYAGPHCDEMMQSEWQLFAVSDTKAIAHDSPNRMGTDTDSEDTPRDLPELPGAYRELQSVSERIGKNATLITGSEFTEAAFKSFNWPENGTLLLATHSLDVEEFGLTEPALVFSSDLDGAAPSGEDGLLTMSEIAALDLPLQLAILAGCYTAGPDGSPRAYPLTGLSLSFLQSGVQSLLVNSFEIRDDASADLTPRFFDALLHENDVGYAEALRYAIDILLKDPAASHLHHPSAWSSYILVGVTP